MMESPRAATDEITPELRDALHGVTVVRQQSAALQLPRTPVSTLLARTYWRLPC